MNERYLEDLKNKVKEACKLFIDRDKQLLDLRVYESAVSHRIAVYLEGIFNDKSLNYDCEYDKRLDLPKRTLNGRGIRPDILVHERNASSRNILAIEIKKKRKSKWDEKKLGMLTEQYGQYKYMLGVFICFPNGEPEYKWFVAGTERNMK